MKRTFQFLTLALALGVGAASAEDVELLNVSYDPTRELYEEYNPAFAAHWKQQTGDTVTINQSHGGSGKQARSVVDGLEADVVTLALAADIDAVAAKGLLPADWQKQRAHNSSPYTSTIVFLVRKGNPKGIKDWDDIVKPGVIVVTPNPKTSGGARWNYLAAWAYAKKKYGTDEGAKRVRGQAVPQRSDTGYRRARLDHYLRAARDRRRAAGVGERGIPRPSTNWGRTSSKSSCLRCPMLAEPPVATVNQIARKHGTLEVANAYLDYLYSPEGQRIAAKHYYRPVSPEHADPADIARFPNWNWCRSTRIWRLGQGAAGALRRRRHLRPDLRNR